MLYLSLRNTVYLAARSNNTKTFIWQDFKIYISSISLGYALSSYDKVACHIESRWSSLWGTSAERRPVLKKGSCYSWFIKRMSTSLVFFMCIYIWKCMNSIFGYTLVTMLENNKKKMYVSAFLKVYCIILWVEILREKIFRNKTICGRSIKEEKVLNTC